MNGKAILSALLATTIASGAAFAQAKSPKLYRWVDKDGKVHYDQALPPEAVNQARREFSTDSGNVTGTVERALTAEERAAIAAAAAAAAEQAEKLDELKRQEEVMMATYSNESDMRRAYGERLTLLKTTLESTDVSIRNVRENLAMMLGQASDAELAGRKVADDRIAAIRELHNEYLKQQQFQVDRRLELEALNSEFARMLERYRQLKNAPAAAAGGAAPAAAPAAPGGAR